MASTDVNSMDPNTDSIIEDVCELKLASPAQPVITERIEIKYEEIPPQVTKVSWHYGITGYGVSRPGIQN